MLSGWLPLYNACELHILNVCLALVSVGLCTLKSTEPHLQQDCGQAMGMQADHLNHTSK